MERIADETADEFRNGSVSDTEEKGDCFGDDSFSRYNTHDNIDFDSTYSAASDQMLHDGNDETPGSNVDSNAIQDPKSTRREMRVQSSSENQVSANVGVKSLNVDSAVTIDAANGGGLASLVAAYDTDDASDDGGVGNGDVVSVGAHVGNVGDANDSSDGRHHAASDDGGASDASDDGQDIAAPEGPPPTVYGPFPTQDMLGWVDEVYNCH